MHKAKRHREEKPTYREYMYYRNGYYVKTKDGRYFVRKKFSKVSIAVIVIIAVLFTIPLFMELFLDLPWKYAISHDLLIVSYILPVFVWPAIFYRFEQFKPAEPDSEEYQKASTKDNFPFVRVFTLVSSAFLIIMLSLSSYSLSYLHSLLDTPELSGSIIVGEAKGDQTERIYELDMTDEGSVMAVTRDITGDVHITVSARRTPEVSRLKLDGDIVAPEHQYQSTSFWFGSDYFSQYYDYTIFKEDIREGSVLMLTLGDWRCQWIFDTRLRLKDLVDIVKRHQ